MFYVIARSPLKMGIVTETFCDVTTCLKYDSVVMVVGWFSSDICTWNMCCLSLSRSLNTCTEILQLRRKRDENNKWQADEKNKEKCRYLWEYDVHCYWHDSPPVCLIFDPGPFFSNRMFLTYLISVNSFGHIWILAIFSSCIG